MQRSYLLPGLLAALVALPLASGSPAGALQSRSEGSRPPAPSDEDLERAWKKLPAEDQAEIVAWFSAEAEWLETLQSRLVRVVLKRQELPPLGWPEAPTSAPVFDPEEHAPDDPIPRKTMSKSRAGRFVKKVFQRVPERALTSIWSYDYGTRQVQRAGDLEDPEHIFGNALAGFVPNLDYAEALVERELDNGAEQLALLAFGHAYSDRSGNVYPGVTLYDAWASGQTIEMPDVECLGIVHTVDDEWRRWKAPVPDSKHDALYSHIAGHFKRARRHRGLRTALARVYLSGKPALRDGYSANLDRFHSLWVKFENDPSKLGADLPDADDYMDWFDKRGREIDTTGALYQGGQARRQALTDSRQAVRGLLVRVMTEFGALEKQ